MDAVFFAGGIAVANVLTAVLLHVGLCRIFPTLDRLGLLVRLFPVVLTSTLLTTYYARHQLVTAMRSGMPEAAIALTGVSLSILFVVGLSSYSAITHSVRLRIGEFVLHSPGQRQSMDCVVQLCDADRETSRRLDQLIHGGYLLREGDVLRLTRKGVFVALVSSAGKRLFNAGLGG